MALSPWSLPLKIIACSFHSVAIACTIFRLTYRWYLARFWWEDGWAGFALVADVVCLVATWLDVPYKGHAWLHVDLIDGWLVALWFPCVLWACRISILLSIIRVANPSQSLRRIACLVGYSFAIMWIGLLCQKIYICVKHSCVLQHSIGISQLITDVISDSALVALPIYFLRQTKITRRQRITIYSVFSASLLITVVTIFHSVAIFTVKSNGIIVIAHVKTALSLIVCNLLVIVAFVYRICRRGKGKDLEVADGVAPLTTVDLNMCFTETATGKCTTTFSEVSTTLDRSHFTANFSEAEGKDEGVMESRSVH